MISFKNYYTVLRVPKDATAEEIRKAYFETARKMHPDANPEKDASDQFIKVQEAYEVLSNPERRTNYLASLGLDEPVQPEISLNILFSRNKISRVEGPQLIYVLLEFTSTAKTVGNSQNPLNLCLVLDRSTSMQGERLDAVKSNALYLLRQLGPEDYFSVVVFSDRAEVLFASMRAANYAKVESIISMLKAGGGTEIYRGLEAGITEIRRNLDASHINHLILLTDGRTYGDEESCLRLAKKVADEGVSISGIGIGDEWNDAFLDKLVGTSGGNSVYISAPKDLRKHLNQKFSHLSRVYAEGITLDLAPNPNVLLQSAFRLFPEPGELPLETPVRLGNIVHGKSLKILLEFLVKSLPQDKNEISLADGRITMEIPSWTVPYARSSVNFECEIRTTPLSEAPHPAIVQAMSRLTLYRMQEKARQEVVDGQPGNASRHLQQLATHLLAQGERDLAKTVLDEAEHVRHSKQFSNEGDKRIKYGTRSLLMLPGPREEA